MDILTPEDPNLQNNAPDSTMAAGGSLDKMQHKTFLVMPQMRRLQNSGFIIIRATPYVGSGHPDWIWENNPRIWMPVTQNYSTDGNIIPFWQSKDDQDEVYCMHPFSILGLPQREGNTLVFTPVRGICGWQFEQPDIISLFAHLCRFQVGSVNLSFRTVGKFTDQADMPVSRVDGITMPKIPVDYVSSGVSSILTSQLPLFKPLFTQIQDYDAHGFLRIDVSNEKHLDISYPYKRMLGFRDMEYTKSRYDQQNDVEDFRQYTVCRVNGTTLSGDDKIIQHIVHRKVSPDYNLFMPMYPFLVNKYDSAFIPPLQCTWDCRFSTQIFGDRSLAPATAYRYRVHVNANESSTYTIGTSQTVFVNNYQDPYNNQYDV